MTKIRVPEDTAPADAHRAFVAAAIDAGWWFHCPTPGCGAGHRRGPSVLGSLSSSTSGPFTLFRCLRCGEESRVTLDPEVDQPTGYYPSQILKPEPPPRVREEPVAPDTARFGGSVGALEAAVESRLVAIDACIERLERYRVSGEAIWRAIATIKDRVDALEARAPHDREPVESPPPPLVAELRNRLAAERDLELAIIHRTLDDAATHLHLERDPVTAKAIPRTPDGYARLVELMVQRVRDPLRGDTRARDDIAAAVNLIQYVLNHDDAIPGASRALLDDAWRRIHLALDRVEAAEADQIEGAR